MNKVIYLWVKCVIMKNIGRFRFPFDGGRLKSKVQENGHDLGERSAVNEKIDVIFFSRQHPLQSVVALPLTISNTPAVESLEQAINDFRNPALSRRKLIRIRLSTKT